MTTDTPTTRFQASGKKQKLQPRISARHGGKVSEETNGHIVKLCGKLEPYFDRIVEYKVVLDTAKPGEKVEIVEIVVKVPQHTFNATAEGENLYKALADAEAKVETQLKKHHDKPVSHH